MELTIFLLISVAALLAAGCALAPGNDTRGPLFFSQPLRFGRAHHPREWLGLP